MLRQLINTVARPLRFAVKPDTTPNTKRQPSPRQYSSGSGFASISNLFGGMGYSEPPPGTFAVYRQIRGNPTVALAYAATVAPVQATPWLFEAMDGVSDEWVKFAQEQCDLIRYDFVEQACRRFYYGFQAFERMYEYRDGRLWVSRLKPLLPDITKPVVDEAGKVIGLENAKVRIEADAMVWTTFDSEADDPYGRSVLENIRSIWHDWCEASKHLGKYVVKNAGIIPLVVYPADEQGENADGLQQDNYKNAQALIASMLSASGVAIPNRLDPLFDGIAGDLLRQGADITQLLSWQIKTLDFKSGAGAEIVSTMQHAEALMVRGMLRPERSLLEGTNGTLAEAQVHTDTGMAQSDRLHHENCKYAQAFLDDVMVANFGPSAKGAVKIMPGSLTSEDKAFFRDFMRQILAGNPDLLLMAADLDAMMDKAGLPKAREILDLTDAAVGDHPAGDAGKGAPADPAADPAKAAADAERKQGVKTGVETAVADLALNGAQVQSMVTLAQQLATGQLPREAVREIMLAAFPNIPEDRINRIVSVLDKFNPPGSTPQDPPPGRRGSADAKLSRTVRKLAARLREIPM